MWLSTDIEAWLATLPVRKLKGEPAAWAESARAMTCAPLADMGLGGGAQQKAHALARAVSMTFAQQPRCLRVAWALDHLFNAKTGYAYPTTSSSPT